MHEWLGILKGVANAIFSYEDVLRVIGELPRLKLEESDTDEELEGTWAESDMENESISKLGKFPSSVMSSQNALQMVVVVMNWSPHFRSTYNARYC